MRQIIFSLTAAGLLAACSSAPMTAPKAAPMSPTFSQAALPAAVQVPAGHKVALETVGAGQITYECRAKKDMPTAFEWVFVGPDAKLMDRKNTVIGKYYGPPATWEANDGSKITGVQVAVSPAAAGSIPLQDRKSTRLNSSHVSQSRMPSSA